MHRWYTFKQKIGTLTPVNKCPHTKISECVIRFIGTHIRENPLITCSTLSKSLAHVFGTPFSRQLVSVAIKRAGYTKKKLRSRPQQTLSSYHNEWVSSFKSRFLGVLKTERPIVSLDETGFDNRLIPLRGYSPISQRLYIRHGKGSWSRNSVLACISLTGEVPHCNYHIQSQSVKGADFMNFMESLTYPSGSVFIMDNIAFHRSSKVMDLAEQRGWELIFTPPYSPNFNPIENIFGAVKTCFRKLNYFSDTGSCDEELIHLAFQQVLDPNIIHGCFAHVRKECSVYI